MSKILKAALLTGALAFAVGQTAYAQVTNRDTTQQQPSAQPASPSDQPSATTPSPSSAQPSATEQQPAAGPMATEPDHKSEAIKHTQAAVDAGKGGSAHGVADHAKEALVHVKAASKEQSAKDQMKPVQKSLEEAVSKGSSGDTDGATKAAEDALTKLQGNSTGSEMGKPNDQMKSDSAKKY